MNQTVKFSDENLRCRWSSLAPEFLDYHDTEWDVPVKNDIKLFEILCLESFQSGLSWRTILAKRENFRLAFLNFDFNKISQFDERDVNRLLKDDGIVRHRGKIEAVINNAKKAQELIQQEGSLATFIWGYEPRRKHTGKPQDKSTSSESIAYPYGLSL